MIISEITTNAKSMIEFLKNVAKELQNLSIPLKQSGMLMMGSVDKNFREQGRPDKWQSLKASTVKNRRKGSATILQDTGRLKGSITLGSPSANSISVGTSVKYAPTHNFGTSKAGRSKNVNIPKRQFMLFQPEDITRIDQVFLKFTGKALTSKTVRIG